MYGKALEIVGHYNPFTKITEVKKERILHWISKGAQLSPTVHNMLIDQNVIKGEKVKASKSKKKGEQPEVVSEAAAVPAVATSAEAQATPAPAAEEPKTQEPLAAEEKPVVDQKPEAAAKA